MSDAFTIPERFRSELRDVLLAHPFPGRKRRPAPARQRLGVGFSAVVALGAAGVAVVLALGSGGELAPQRASAASVLRASAGALERSGASLALGRGDSQNGDLVALCGPRVPADRGPQRRRAMDRPRRSRT